MAGRTTTVRLVGMSRLSAWARRRRFIELSTWLLIIVAGPIVLPDAFMTQQFEDWILLALCFGAAMKALHYASGFSRVTLGVDRIVARSLVGSYAIRQAELERFRYVGSETEPREWYLETANGLHPVGAGPAANALIKQMVAQWPQIPRPSDAQLRALGAADYRHESKDPAELLAMLRIPSLDSAERVRIAELLKPHGPEYQREVAAVAEATLDAEERARLLRVI